MIGEIQLNRRIRVDYSLIEQELMSLKKQNVINDVRILVNQKYLIIKKL